MADSKVLGLFWWPWHNDWVKYKNYNPYLERGKHPNQAQWLHKSWQPADWIAQRQNGLQLIDGFYKADILRDQEVDDDIPVLVVGPNFYRLSGYDKRRVTETVDAVYEITASQDDAIFIVEDWHTHLPIGVYTKHGLQLQ